MSIKKLIYKYFRDPLYNEIIFRYTRKQFIRLGREARMRDSNPRRG